MKRGGAALGGHANQGHSVATIPHGLLLLLWTLGMLWMLGMLWTLGMLSQNPLGCLLRPL